MIGGPAFCNYQETGRKLVSAFDSLNRLTSITETLSASTGSRVTGYAYDIAGNVLKRIQANGTVENSAYDPLGRRRFQQTLSGGQPVSCFSYGYDAAGSVTGIDESYASSTIPDRKVTNTYDRTYRLLFEKTDTLTTAAAVSQTTLTGYQYDAANNRTLKTVAVSTNGNLLSSNTATAVYGNSANGKNSNQLVSYNDTATGLVSTYDYDLNGNRQTKSINGTLKETYHWDSRNRLTSLVQPTPAKTYRYGYDYRMRRVSRDESSAGGENTVCSFSGGTCAFEKVASAVRVEYVRGSDYGGGIGGILYSVRSGANSFNAYNSRGDVVAKTNSGGGVTWEATYEAFGTRTTESGTNPDRQKANTKEEDPTGLLNEGFRYRDLETGMFISRDPMGFVDGPNVYSYVQQNPWTKFDPDGLFWSAAINIGFAAWDTYQVATGGISKTEYAGRMALTGAALVADAATGGMGGGMAVRAAAVAARAGKVGQMAVKAATAVDRANTAYETGSALVENGAALAEASSEGDKRGMLKAAAGMALEMAVGKKADGALGAVSQRNIQQNAENVVESIGDAAKKPVVIGGNMKERVIPHAEEIGGHFYKPKGEWTLDKNKRWAEDMKRQVDRGERNLVDIGPDPERKVPSEAYQEERKIFYPEEEKQ